MVDRSRGWEDPVGQLVRLRDAIDIMLANRENYRERMTKTTDVLAGVRREAVPERIRPLINRIMDVRVSVYQDYGDGHQLWHFERLTPKQRKLLRNDIVKLYEACIFDVALGGHDFMYPKAEPGDWPPR